MLRILSLGAGVQSSAILLMAVRGELPKPDHAIFADTGDEPDEVYDYLDYLEPFCISSGIKLHVVRRDGDTISEHVHERSVLGKRLDKPPWFTLNAQGGFGIVNRDCTKTWKVLPIQRRVKEILGLTKGQSWPKTLQVEQWLGISADEIQRCKVSTEPWQRFWHPLVEEPWEDGKDRARPRMPAISRQSCLAWVERNGFKVPPRSACWHCPFRSNAGWRHLRDNEPHNYQRAIELDDALRTGPNGVLHGMRQEVFIHRSLVPLRDARIDETTGDLFDNECAGVCGV